MTRNWQRLNVICTDLQQGVMKARMQPIDSVWSKLPRIVRDLGVHVGKQVRLEMIGAETELDRSVIEAIKDPLTHLVRNAIDHGIEAPELRAARGKPAEGRLSLRAFHDGGQVNLEISDDGAGIDPVKIGAKAVERGLLTADQLAAMSEREIINMIFLAGFSTAEEITNVSGRGVGMDVVKTNMERIGGSVEVSARPGVGTTFRIKIPLTLAIVSAIVVACAEQRLAIPQASLLEIIRLEGDERTTRIEHISGAPVFRLRDNLIPLVSLREALGFPAAELDDRSWFIAVLGNKDRQYGLLVDRRHRHRGDRRTAAVGAPQGHPGVLRRHDAGGRGARHDRGRLGPGGDQPGRRHRRSSGGPRQRGAGRGQHRTHTAGRTDR